MNSISTEIKYLFENLVTAAYQLIPNIILAIIVTFVGFLLARIFQKLIKRFMVYLNRKINKELRNQLLSIDLLSSADFIAKSSFWIILFFTIVIVTQILELSLLTLWFDGLVHYIPNLLAAIIIIFCGFAAGKLVHDLISSSASRTGFYQGKNIGRFIQYIIRFITLIIAADQIGLDILFLTNLVTIVLAIILFGAALAFGLGSKNSVSNILASYYIQKFYQTGNQIQIGEIEGVIVKITNSSVFLETKNGQVSVPAKVFNNEKVLLIKKN